MNYNIKSLDFFKKQVQKLDSKARKLIYDKIQLMKQNPYRYKKIHSKKYPRVFRIRFNISGKEIRLIYVIIEPNIILVCLLDRKKNYKDLEKYLLRLKDMILNSYNNIY